MGSGDGNPPWWGGSGPGVWGLHRPPEADDIL